MIKQDKEGLEISYSLLLKPVEVTAWIMFANGFVISILTTGVTVATESATLFSDLMRAWYTKYFGCFQFRCSHKDLAGIRCTKALEWLPVELVELPSVAVFRRCLDEEL